jgi:acyl-CoA synthetase (AMP-forming)/AMP-acid ligase II
MISHGNLAHNQMLIAEELRTTPDTVCVSWLPQYHDMGLIGSYLGTLYCGGIGYYMSPLSFLKDPLLWPRSLSRFKASHTQAPNFAFALAARKLREWMRDNPNSQKPGQSQAICDGSTPNRTLDLSTVEHMINAAEPVDAYALKAFRHAFDPYGLNKNVIVPTYGLAEHTVFVCSGGKQILNVYKSELENNIVMLVSDKEMDVKGGVQTLVGCGYPGNAEGVDLRIVDDSTTNEVDEDKVGEIYVSSPSKAQGYWNRPDVTQSDFKASIKEYLNNNTTKNASSYLRTGDLGFLHGGELFVCGRLKDLLIVRGTNHYPQLGAL